MARPRDTQFARFWKATRVLDSFAVQMETDKEVARYIKRSCERAFLMRRYPLTRAFEIEHLSRPQRETANGWSIGVPVDRRDSKTVIYCITRLIWSRVHPHSAFTGPEWAAIYLDVVQALMGRPAADLLKSSYRLHSVKWRP